MSKFLDRYPIFVFDSKEKWGPVGVEESLNATGAKVPLSLPIEGVSQRVASADRIDFPADMKQPDLPAVVYTRKVKGGGLVWEQFWLWYLYNPKQYAGVGCHEGDWEFVQIGYGGDQPILMTCSQHHTGGKREFWMVEKRSNRPVVYVARDSHANYFEPVKTLEDVCDGRGRVLIEYAVRDFGPWASWPGRWGNSTGEGRSPESPGRQRQRWNSPHLYHSSAR